jgi:hypothetical protein
MRVKSNLYFIKTASCFGLTLAVYAFLTFHAQGQRRVRTIKKAEPNVHAANLYADRIKLKLTLINLPGADEPGSTWEASYQIYFISEENFKNALRSAPQGGWNPSPADFPGRILLGEGRIKRTPLRTLAERTYMSKPLPLKGKVADGSRTKFATILTSYSVKIFDARLKSNIYRAGTFVAKPFTGDASAGENEAARTLLYANFYVSPNGQLFYSQRPRNTEATTWP